MVEAGRASRIDDLCKQRPSDPLVARVGPYVDVGDVRRLAPPIAEDAEDEPDCFAVLLRGDGPDVPGIASLD